MAASTHGRSDRTGDCTAFVELMLAAQRDALSETIESLRPRRPTSPARIATARDRFGDAWFRRSDYLRLHPTISPATASRDLAAGVANGALDVRGERRLTEYRFH